MPIRFVCPVCWTVRDDIDDSLLGKPIKCNDCHAMAVAKHTPEPNYVQEAAVLGNVAVKPASAPETISLTPIAPWEAPSPPAVPVESSVRILLSTGDIPEKYQIVDLVFAHGSSSEGALKGMEPPQAFQILASWLGQTALKAGADAVINIRIDFKIAQGLLGARAFEVFAYGTAVKLIR
jgi:hypothetical protein